MIKKESVTKSVSVPYSRLSRFGHIGAMAGGIAGNMIAQGIVQLGKGQQPSLRDLMLTPKNINRLTNRLAKLRGAAMKIGQLISLDTGDFLPPDLSLIMARLRENADSMPPRQLKKVLNTEWPKDWLNEFASFDVHPMAAASIGQVHRAQLKDGRKLAIKVQYPGVKESIDSDIENVAVLIKLSGLLPSGFTLAPYLHEAKQQLHSETDYIDEARNLKRFGGLLHGSQKFIIPEVYDNWSTPNILAMDYLEGIPIEDTTSLPQPERNKIAQNLVDLTLSELFIFGVMQTDPNFANYRYQLDSKKIGLLDFGATRDITAETVEQYRRLLSAGLSCDDITLMETAQEIGFFDASASINQRKTILGMLQLIFEALNAKGQISFGDHAIPKQLQVEAFELIKDQFTLPPLPIEVLLLQRKLGGIFLLCAHIGAFVDITNSLAQHVDHRTQ
jgi:predicted unusual protein kinase regulating ubiquinone biosynthesis (AarF/ABC1/UbiB family)